MKGTLMAIFKPFKAVRPAKEYASKIAALPYDVMNRDEAYDMAKDDPYSFLHVDRAEIDLPRDMDQYSPRVYEKAAENLKALQNEGALIKDTKTQYYIYTQIMNGRSQTGLVGLASIDDYINSVIKKHELTRAEKEQDRINHVDKCDANTGPIFLTYRERPELSRIINEWQENHLPVYDFVSGDGVGHKAWVIDSEEIIGSINKEAEKISAFYIADGHHRAASAVNVGLKRRAEHPDYEGNEEFNFFLAVLFPDSELKILDYNRVVRDLNGLSDAEFISRVSERFNIEEADEAYKPKAPNEFGMYLSGKWYCLKAKDDICHDDDVVKRLDVSILYDNLLAPVLNIGDARVDKRIDFIGGIRGLSELEKRVNEDWAVAFSMYPTSIGELMDIADAGKLMPPKSTWFEPKLRSGLFIHELS